MAWILGSGENTAVAPERICGLCGSPRRAVPYLIPPDGQEPGYPGYPAIPDTKQVEAYLDEAYGKGWPVKVLETIKEGKTVWSRK